MNSPRIWRRAIGSERVPSTIAARHFLPEPPVYRARVRWDAPVPDRPPKPAKPLTTCRDCGVVITEGAMRCRPCLFAALPARARSVLKRRWRL